MFNQKVKSHAQLMPTIICTADLSAYLVGAEDENGAFHNIYSQQQSKPLLSPSLEHAKKMLREKGVTQVMIVMQTPYDEMIGQQSYGPTRLLETL